ncbi:MAG: bifunctional molybdenum cofactor biosynthesis protein MoaC/MoaB [Candidatus Omnitrophica bacterium]|nr:bifunctional molybdenum cofactor biosynthesis protein MoaC/MoaB [Candidatus Omnitrophota bacterium]
MKSITHKINTLRKATAISALVAKPETIQRLRSNDLPKKDALVVARVAAVSAAKKTHELIPYCHPIPIDSVSVEFEVGKDRVTVTATVEAIWKTGVEMETLTAASVAALTLYDMLKPVDKEMEIVSTKLVSKEGGKSDFVEKIPKGFQAAVIVTSDGTFKGTRQDKSGKIIQERLESFGIQPTYHVLPDEQQRIAELLKKLCDGGVQLILTTGGTGLGPRDVTVEATRQVIEREIPGILEAGRAFGQQRTPYAMLSRGIAGQKGKTLIVNLPGSSKGVEETLDAIFPAILHSYKMMGGGGH